MDIKNLFSASQSEHHKGILIEQILNRFQKNQ